MNGNDYPRTGNVRRAIETQYQRWLLTHFRREWRISIARCETQEDQRTYGDTFLGLDIRYDDKLIHTGQFGIEYRARLAPTAPFVPSGICAESSAWLYGIGNYREFFIFSKRVLVRILESQLCYDESQRSFQFYETPTSRGFLLPRRTATEIAEHMIVLVAMGEGGEHDVREV